MASDSPPRPDRFGPYSIVGLLGAGGMGEVYRARDARLGRDVALKILPAAFLSDPDRLARFEREARILASLNHPRIGAIYGVEESDGVRALVLEIVEGPTLAERLRAGSMSIGEALAVARQIAEALEAAHDRGIVHRDLKPANVKLTADGSVKVLDFGLARTLEPPEAVGSSPTVTADGTQSGAILGTAAYMSPEQARGQPVDRRTDVWALGCVLYEMLTGRRAFGGDTLSDTIAAVIHDEPRWDALPPDTPPLVVSFLRQCLRKPATQRLRDAGDLRLALDGAFDTAAAPAPRRHRSLVWMAAAAVLAAVAGGLVGWSARPAPPGPVARLSHALPQGSPFGSLGRALLAIAPDGSSVVFAGRDRLYRRAIGELEAVPVHGTDGTPASPFFSPDGQSIGYWDAAAGELRRVSVTGGVPLSLTKATTVYGASWEADDTVLYGQEDGIWRVAAKGGSPEHLIRVEPEELVYGPRLLARSDAVLFSVVKRSAMVGQATAWDNAQIVLQAIGSRQRRVITRGADARLLPTGHLVYALNNVLFAAPFNRTKREIEGTPVPVVEGVQRPIMGSAGRSGSGNYDVSLDGTLAYVPAFWELRNVPRRLLAIDRTGNAEPLIADERNYWRPRISPDGTRVAVEVLGRRQNTDVTAQIWIVDLKRRTSVPLTAEGTNAYVVWTPDSQSIVYAGLTGDSTGLYQQAADGATPARLLLGSPHGRPMDISRDGVLAISIGSPHEDIQTLEPGSEEPQDFLSTPAKEQMARFSPDGKWLAYSSNESGQDEVYVRPFPRRAGVGIPVSAGGGNAPVWSPDGSALYYTGSSGELMMVPTTLSPGFAAGRPRPLFTVTSVYRMSGTATAYDIHPQDRRFIMVSEPEDAEVPRAQINIVLNWFDELRSIAAERR